MQHHDSHSRGFYLMYLVVILGALTITGCYDGSEDGTMPQTGGETPSSSTVSFIVDVQPIFTQNCALSGCHDAVTSTLGLNLEAGVAFDHIVAVPSRQAPAQHYVAPGDPDNSYLFRKIAGAPGIIGNRMPLNNMTFFQDNPEQLELIRLWILEGARPTTVSFVTDVQPIFTQNCALLGCHNAATNTLGLNLEAGAAFDNIVAVPSRQAPAQHYVTPGDPDNSYLFRKIAGDPGIVSSRMPLNNVTFFEDNPEQLELIRLWILEGAMNDEAASQ